MWGICRSGTRANLLVAYPLIWSICLRPVLLGGGLGLPALGHSEQGHDQRRTEICVERLARPSALLPPLNSTAVCYRPLPPLVRIP